MKKEAWENRFVSLAAFIDFRMFWPVRSFTYERSFLFRDLDRHNPAVQDMKRMDVVY